MARKQKVERALRTSRPKPGVYEEISFSEYQSWPYINASSLGAAVRSAGHYDYDQRHPRQYDSDELRFGTLCHTMLAGVLTGSVMIDSITWEDMRNRYAVPTRTREWEHRVAKIRADQGDVKVYTPDEWHRACAVVETIDADDRCREYLRAAAYEMSIVWNDPVTKLRCKARLDAVNDAGISDLKTTRDAAVFDRSIRQFHYHRQMAYYQWGWAMLNKGELLEARLIAVESHPFHGVKAAPLSEQALEVGRREFQLALARISQARSSGMWAGYPQPDEWDVPDLAEKVLIIDGEETTW